MLCTIAECNQRHDAKLSISLCLFVLRRTTHFFASSDKAKRDLDWKPKHDFLSDIGALVADYNAQGRASQFIDFTIDDKIIAATSTA